MHVALDEPPEGWRVRADWRASGTSRRHAHAAESSQPAATAADSDSNRRLALLKFFDGCRGGRVADVAALLKHSPTFVNRVDRLGNTALHLAAARGHTAVARLLLKVGADPAAVDYNGDTPLQWCVHYGMPGLVQLLLSRGARVDAPNQHGDLPIHAAAWGGSTVVVKLLIAARADAEARGCGGETPLAIAALRGHLELARFLLSECLVSVDAAATDGTTPLLLAAEHSAADTGMTRLLLAHGAASSDEAEARRRASTLAVETRAADDEVAADAAAGHSAGWVARMREMKPHAGRLLLGGNEPPDEAHGEADGQDDEKAGGEARAAAHDSASAVALVLEHAGVGGALDRLSKYRGARTALRLPPRAAVLRAPGALSPEACAQLRSAIDTRGSITCDSVDGLPNHDLLVTPDDLVSIIGKDEARRLLGLTSRFNAEAGGGRPLAGGADAPPMKPIGFFGRRYSPDSIAEEQPLTSFHFDSAAVTVNVALTDDASLAGGRLLGVYAGAVHTIRRSEGEATVHSSLLLHAVSRMRRGMRYSLIMFFAFPSTGDGVDDFPVWGEAG